MKETKIAKENIITFKDKDFDADVWLRACLEHKQTCQRWLEFLEEEMGRWNVINKISEAYISTGELEEKIQDLKQAIKIYEDAGI